MNVMTAAVNAKGIKDEIIPLHARMNSVAVNKIIKTAGFHAPTTATAKAVMTAQNTP